MSEKPILVNEHLIFKYLILPKHQKKNKFSKDLNIKIFRNQVLLKTKHDHLYYHRTETQLVKLLLSQRKITILFDKPLTAINTFQDITQERSLRINLQNEKHN